MNDWRFWLSCYLLIVSPGCMQADFCESYVTMEPGVFYSAYPLPDGSYACLKVTVAEDGTMESQQEIPESEWRKQTKKTQTGD